MACKAAAQITALYDDCRGCGRTMRRFASDTNRQFCSDACYRQHTVGPAHPNYRGGRWLKHGQRWERIRRTIIERDKVCRWCGTDRSSDGRGLHVHHIDGRRNYEDVNLANRPDNLVTLCGACHMRVEMFIKHGRTAELPTDLRPPQSAPSR